MPANAEGLVAEALAEVSELTGLRFVVEGPTDEAPSEDRQPFQPDRYGDRWAPVLVAWSDAAEYPELGANVAGVGGSQQIAVSPDVSAYVTGIVYLDGEDFAEMTWDGGRDAGRAVVLHELGHLLGLGHVDDPGQLMHDQGHPGLTTFASGDLAGLHLLSRGACVPQL